MTRRQLLHVSLLSFVMLTLAPLTMTASIPSTEANTLEGWKTTLKRFHFETQRDGTSVVARWSHEPFRLSWTVRLGGSVLLQQPVEMTFVHGNVRNYILLQELIAEAARIARRKDPQFHILKTRNRYIGGDEQVATTQLSLVDGPGAQEFTQILRQRIHRLSDKF